MNIHRGPGISALLAFLFLTVFLASCVPANVPDDAVLASGRQAKWRTDWNVGPIVSDVLPVQLIPVSTGLTMPVAIVSVDDGSGSLLIAEQQGRVLRLSPGADEASTVLDLSDSISCCGERGLIGLETHPDIARNGLIYVHYTDRNGDTVIAEFTLEGAAADPDSERILFTLEQPGITHNGGQLAFGPDGWLYFSLGDGMFSPIPLRRAQDPEVAYGTISRLDPRVAESAETVALGLRNPWRFSFDRHSGDIWIADVGQSGYEEINRIPAGTTGLNFGWPDLEGPECMTSTRRCSMDYTAPVIAYDHSHGCSVTGGYVYRGEVLQELQGHYLFTDFCSGTIWSLDTEAASPRARVLFDSSQNIATFGEDEFGELYAADFALGTLYQLVPMETGGAG